MKDMVMFAIVSISERGGTKVCVDQFLRIWFLSFENLVIACFVPFLLWSRHTSPLNESIFSNEFGSNTYPLYVHYKSLDGYAGIV